MKIGSMLVTLLMVSGMLAIAQTCPSTGCLVAGVPQATTPAPVTSTVCPAPVTSTVCPAPTVSSVCPVQVGVNTGLPFCAGNMSNDTSCTLSALNAIRGEIRASALELRGQMLIGQVDQLMNDEATFRAQLAANPNLPGGQTMSMGLAARANALNRDIAAYTRELNMVSPEMRPYVVTRLNTFDTLYWSPALARLSNYSTTFAQSSTIYQPAFAANPWLQPWWTGYQTSLNTLGQYPQTYASVRWWTGPQVLGSTEIYQGQMMTTVPSGSVVYIPPQGVPYASAQMSTHMPIGTNIGGNTGNGSLY